LIRSSCSSYGYLERNGIGGPLTVSRKLATVSQLVSAIMEEGQSGCLD
ncbi:hypothetical protein BAE44_0023850, partial [Dichanthelium oligosanthes]